MSQVVSLVLDCHCRAGEEDGFSVVRGIFVQSVLEMVNAAWAARQELVSVSLHTLATEQLFTVLPVTRLSAIAAVRSNLELFDKMSPVVCSGPVGAQTLANALRSVVTSAPVSERSQLWKIILVSGAAQSSVEFAQLATAALSDGRTTCDCVFFSTQAPASLSSSAPSPSLAVFFGAMASDTIRRALQLTLPRAFGLAYSADVALQISGGGHGPLTLHCLLTKSDLYDVVESTAVAELLPHGTVFAAGKLFSAAQPPGPPTLSVSGKLSATAVDDAWLTGSPYFLTAGGSLSSYLDLCNNSSTFAALCQCLQSEADTVLLLTCPTHPFAAGSGASRSLVSTARSHFIAMAAQGRPSKGASSSLMLRQIVPQELRLPSPFAALSISQPAHVARAEQAVASLPHISPATVERLGCCWNAAVSRVGDPSHTLTVSSLAPESGSRRPFQIKTRNVLHSVPPQKGSLF